MPGYFMDKNLGIQLQLTQLSLRSGFRVKTHFVKISDRVLITLVGALK